MHGWNEIWNWIIRGDRIEIPCDIFWCTRSFILSWESRTWISLSNPLVVLFESLFYLSERRKRTSCLYLFNCCVVFCKFHERIQKYQNSVWLSFYFKLSWVNIWKLQNSTHHTWYFIFYSISILCFILL